MLADKKVEIRAYWDRLNVENPPGTRRAEENEYRGSYVTIITSALMQYLFDDVEGIVGGSSRTSWINRVYRIIAYTSISTRS